MTADVVPFRRKSASGLCVSCRTPISVTAEWCCEPCAVGNGHSAACRTSERSAWPVSPDTTNPDPDWSSTT